MNEKQVARSMSLPLTMALSSLLLRKSCSYTIIFSCALVTYGFIVGTTLDSLSYDSAGFLFGMVSSVATAASSVLVKSSLTVVNDETLHLMYYNNFLTMGIMVPFIMLSGMIYNISVGRIPFNFLRLGELGSLGEFLQQDNTTLLAFLSNCILTVIMYCLPCDSKHANESREKGLIGFLINMAGFLQIKVTSPVTHMISATVKGVIQTFIAIYIFGEVVSFNRSLGIALTICGSILYTWTRNQESQPASPYTQACQSEEMAIQSERKEGVHNV